MVGGFVLVNDFSARDVQFREMVEGLMGSAKSKDFGTALGSIVVTSPEFLRVLDTLDAEVRVNGDVWGAGSTRGIQHSLADVVAYASAGERLAAGTVIGLGTVPGCSGVETGRWLAPNRVLDQAERWELHAGWQWVVRMGRVSRTGQVIGDGACRPQGLSCGSWH